jgi:hypothetical protein
MLELAYIQLSQRGKARYPFPPCLSCTCGSCWGEKGGDHRPLEVDRNERLDWQEGDVLTNLKVKREIRILCPVYAAHSSVGAIEEDLEFISACQ